MGWSVGLVGYLGEFMYRLNQSQAGPSVFQSFSRQITVDFTHDWLSKPFVGAHSSFITLLYHIYASEHSSSHPNISPNHDPNFCSAVVHDCFIASPLTCSNLPPQAVPTWPYWLTNSQRFPAGHWCETSTKWQGL